MNYTPQDLDIFPGFYESVLYHCDTEYNFNYEEKRNDPDNYVEKELDFELFTKEVCEGITSLIGDILGAEAKFKDMHSPAYYNYSTDKLEMEIAIDPEKIKSEILSSEELSKGFDKYLKSHYTSRSGFISFVENNIDEYFDKGEYADVMIDYYLLTKIYDNADVVKCQRDFDGTSYFEECLDIANDALYNHMVEIKKEEIV